MGCFCSWNLHLWEWLGTRAVDFEKSQWKMRVPWTCYLWNLGLWGERPWGASRKGNWRKGDPHSVLAESWATLLFVVMWKADNVPHELGDLAEVHFQAIHWFPLAASTEGWEKRNKWREGLLHQKGARDLMVLKILGHSIWQMTVKFKTWVPSKVSSRALPGENGSLKMKLQLWL